MSREARLNLIFFVVLVAVVAPGGYMLFRKKLHDTGKPMFEPIPVWREAALIDPRAPQHVPRTRPVEARDWLATQVPQQPGVVRFEDAVSDGMTFECLAVLPGGDGDAPPTPRLVLLLWQPERIANLKSSLLAMRQHDDTGQPLPLTPKLVLARPIPVPSALRDAWKRIGFYASPQTAALVALDVPGLDAARPFTLAIDWPGDPDQVTATPH